MTAPNSEIGRAVARVLRTSDARVPTGGPYVLLNLSLQPPNNLLHDGHRWARYSPGRMLKDTELALKRKGPDLVVHASYAFLAAIEAGAVPGDRLAPLSEAAAQAERIVLASDRPACVLRLGYLYGPGFDDLKAYRLAFRLARPYWAGPARNLQVHLHADDAATALLQAAQEPPADIAYAGDERPASFRAFMDHFARLVGNPLPQHLPRISRILSHLVIAEEHMQMVEIGVRDRPSAMLPGFRPRYRDYRRDWPRSSTPGRTRGPGQW